jgi:hypothetical protein
MAPCFCAAYRSPVSVTIGSAGGEMEQIDTWCLVPAGLFGVPGAVTTDPAFRRDVKPSGRPSLARVVERRKPNRIWGMSFGPRLYLPEKKEDRDAKAVEVVRRRNLPGECEEGMTRFLVHFRVDGVRLLIGSK